MQKICENKKCYGCGACCTVCPKDAISLKENETTGHLRPVIDQGKCIDCGLCSKHCPANSEYKYKDNTVTYAAYRTDPEKQNGSSSGGVAAAFYELAIDKNWAIVGTIMDSNFKARMELSCDKQNIEQFKGSKYVQAYPVDALNQVKSVLKEGKNVLFIGTPCECEAARSIAMDNAERLLTVDLICHGVPSYKVLRDYIKWVEVKKKSKIQKISFRSSWGEEMILNDGKKNVWHRRMWWDPYLEAFNSGIINNDACFECPFAREKRCSDLTIGDFWGIGSEAPFHKPNRKVSVIGVNSKRGFDFLNECKSLVLEKRNWSEAVAGNSQLRAPLPKSSQYDLFWEKYYKYGIDAAFKATVYKKVCKRYYKEYPIILSTTFSSLSSLQRDAVYDYIIMDEASQVSVETGALALSCAKNAIIVGDTMQLPNVVTEENKEKLNFIANACLIKPEYDCANMSFLQSICKVIPNVPQTLLREHYRCHPRIINFCNQKFYGGDLVIMTRDKGEEDVICAIRTAKGNHSRSHMNQREIDVIKEEVLPNLSYETDEIGVIAPYNKQVDAVKSALEEDIDVATVHKFQGREKDAIIMTTVDDVITSFSDDPNLLNVAVSRAKSQFYLVVSGNEQPKDCNISDLIAYIEYNNGTVSTSKIHSIFDYLYEQYTDARIAYLKKHKKISEYDSENLTFALLEDILKENINMRHLNIICHLPLYMLIQDYSLLNEEESKYAANINTHIDFLIYNRVSKQPVLAIETDGYAFHKSGTSQSERDIKKNHILELYGIPLVRLSTIGSNEKKVIGDKLSEVLNLH